MYRANTPPPPPDPIEAAREPIKTAAGLQLGIAGMSAFSFILYSLRLAFWKPDPSLPPDIAAWRGPILWWSFGIGGAITIILGVWSFLNARGLKKMSRAARWSSIAFAGVTLAMCCFGPFSGFLLYLLLRTDVKTAFQKRA